VAENRANKSKEFEFTARDFDRVRGLIYSQAGISLASTKQEMVYSRLARRLRAVGMTSFETYLDTLESGSFNDEWESFVNALTTNLTSFFREEHHFPILHEFMKNRKGPVEVWCSASSTGEEPYSIAITLCEAFGTLTPPAKIVATDIDTNVLATAEAGIYSADKLGKMSPDRMRKFFQKGKGDNAGMVRVRKELRDMITFRQLNLLGDNWSVRGGFDVIFCRNVMIYFDKPTQGKILSRFVTLMKPDGLLFAGHSENFQYISNALKLRGKTVYQLANPAAANSSARE
jgi:chemotaxis protein methyltransferase CheR